MIINFIRQTKSESKIYVIMENGKYFQKTKSYNLKDLFFKNRWSFLKEIRTFIIFKWYTIYPENDHLIEIYNAQIFQDRWYTI